MSATQHAIWLQHIGWPDHNSRQHRRTCFDAGWDAGRADLEAQVWALVEAADRYRHLKGARTERESAANMAAWDALAAALAPFQVKP